MPLHDRQSFNAAHEKSGAVLANDRYWPGNRNRAQDGGKPAIEANEQKTITMLKCVCFGARALRPPSQGWRTFVRCYASWIGVVQAAQYQR